MAEPLLMIGALQITPFSIAVFAGAVLGAWCLIWLAHKSRLTEQALIMLPLSILLGVFCGHALFAVTRVMIYPLDYEHPFAFIMNPASGGFMYLGSFFGGAVAALITSRISHVRFDRLMKILIPSMLLTLAIVRFAEPLDFQGKGPEAAGGFFPFSFAPEVDYPEDRYIPVFFYEGVYALFISVWGALNAIEKTKKEYPPRFFFILYLTGQMFFEVFRQDEYINATSLITFIRLNQLFAAILLGEYLVIAVIRCRKRVKPRAVVIRCVVFVISVGACVGLQFLFDKPMPLFGRTVWFADWLVYLLLALAAVGMGWPVISLTLRAADTGKQKSA